MQKQEMHLNYQEAIHLIRVGRYVEALELLLELDKARPDVKNVLYPIAVCHERLGHADQALSTCQKLIDLFDHEQARVIKARLETGAPFPGATNAVVPPQAAPKEGAPPPQAPPQAAPPPPSPSKDEEIPDTIPLALEASDDDSDFEFVAPEDIADDLLGAPADALVDEEAEADVKAETAGVADQPKHRQMPTWLALLIAFVAAAVIAGLVHWYTGMISFFPGS